MLILAGLQDCGIGAYHLVLPYQMDWADGLRNVPASLVWGIGMLNVSWSLVAITMGCVVFCAVLESPRANFARRVVFAFGLFWMIHSLYLWSHPVPVPASLLWLKYLLAGFSLISIVLHWLPLWSTRHQYA